MGKPSSLPLAEGTDSQEQLHSRAPPGVRLRQGHCPNQPPAWPPPSPLPSPTP